MTETIGGRHGRVDAVAQVTGAARFADDLSLPRMLHAKILRSPHAHARVRQVDASAALALDGVHAVITGADLPTTYGSVFNSEGLMLSGGRVTNAKGEVHGIRGRLYIQLPSGKEVFREFHAPSSLSLKRYRWVFRPEDPSPDETAEEEEEE